jgi:hypothetical protein
MPIPSVRARVYCNLGTVISGQFGDDYIQESGLSRTRGSVLLDGILTPNVGTKVEFAYEKYGLIARIPRTFRVLSSFSDPFSRTTKVSIGCLLSYLREAQVTPSKPSKEERQDADGYRIKGSADPDGGGSIPENERRVLGSHITAKFIVNTLLDELGVAHGSINLTNKFLADEEIVRGPFLDKVSDLIEAEGLYGYLSPDESLKVIDLKNPGGTLGPVIRTEHLLGVDRIGSGEQPGEEVAVKFTTTRLNSVSAQALAASDEEASSGNGLSGPTPFQPTPEFMGNEQEPPATKLFGIGVIGVGQDGSPKEETTQSINWEMSTSESLESTITVARKSKVKDEPPEEQSFAGLTWSRTYTFYKQLNGKSVPDWRRTFDKTFMAEAATNIVQQRWEAGFISANPSLFTVTTTVYYYDELGNETSVLVTKQEPEAVIFGRSNIPAAQKKGKTYTLVSINETQLHTTSIEIRETRTAKTDEGAWQQTFRQEWTLRMFTLQGQIAILKDPRASARLSASYLAALFRKYLNGGLVQTARDVETNFVSQSTSQERPSGPGNRTAGYAAPKKGPEVDTVKTSLPSSNVVDASRSIELELPATPDDVLTSGGTVIKSDAEEKAKNYGRTQNRLKAGHRGGFNIKIPPELAPDRPFSPIYLQAAGLTGQYRTNGQSWTFDANGLVVSIDCLFWGGAGQE